MRSASAIVSSFVQLLCCVQKTASSWSYTASGSQALSMTPSEMILAPWGGCGTAHVFLLRRVWHSACVPLKAENSPVSHSLHLGLLVVSVLTIVSCKLKLLR